MNNIEIEIQVKVDNVEPLREFLEASAKKVKETRQVDEYFNPGHRDFLASSPVIEWLRLRDANGSVSVNYKHYHYDEDGKSQYCDEYETPVGDIKQMQQMFAALDIKSLVIVDKTRTIYLWENFEVSLDHVEGLGDFVEVEYKGEARAEDAKEITDSMVAFLKQHQVGKVCRNYVGYPFQLLFPGKFSLEEY
jgi:adenylate cyclase class 2